jgi:hypothetical protein
MFLIKDVNLNKQTQNLFFVGLVTLGLGLVFWTLFYFQGFVCFNNWIDIKIDRNKLDIQVIYHKNVIHMRSFYI